MNRLNKVKGMTQMIRSNQSIISTYMLTFFGKSSTSLTFFGKTFNFVDLFLGNVRFRWPFLGNVWFRWPFLGYFESIQLIQSCQSLKANRLSHLLYENELTQSPINSLGKGTESIQSILRKNELIQVNQLRRVDWYTSLFINRHNLYNKVCIF